MVKLVENVIDPAAVYGLINSDFSGSVLFHFAVVKQQAGSGRTTNCIEYRAHGDTLQELEDIVGVLKSSWKLEDVLLIRRTGCLAVGDIISLVAVSSPNSEDALEACRQGLSDMKQMTTITKTEKFADSE